MGARFFDDIEWNCSFSFCFFMFNNHCAVLDLFCREQGTCVFVYDVCMVAHYPFLLHSKVGIVIISIVISLIQLYDVCLKYSFNACKRVGPLIHGLERLATQSSVCGSQLYSIRIRILSASFYSRALPFWSSISCCFCFFSGAEPLGNICRSAIVRTSGHVVDPAFASFYITVSRGFCFRL